MSIYVYAHVCSHVCTLKSHSLRANLNKLKFLGFWKFSDPSPSRFVWGLSEKFQAKKFQPEVFSVVRNFSHQPHLNRVGLSEIFQVRSNYGHKGGSHKFRVCLGLFRFDMQCRGKFSLLRWANHETSTTCCSDMYMLVRMYVCIMYVYA